MIMQTSAFFKVGGFDERYFLYLEDADLTRSMSSVGQCVHYPIAFIVHKWGKGNYKSLKLLLVNILSTYYYFIKWGLALW